MRSILRFLLYQAGWELRRVKERQPASVTFYIDGRELARAVASERLQNAARN